MKQIIAKKWCVCVPNQPSDKTDFAVVAVSVFQAPVRLRFRTHTNKWTKMVRDLAEKTEQEKKPSETCKQHTTFTAVRRAHSSCVFPEQTELNWAKTHRDTFNQAAHDSINFAVEKTLPVYFVFFFLFLFLLLQNFCCSSLLSLVSPSFPVTHSGDVCPLTLSVFFFAPSFAFTSTFVVVVVVIVIALCPYRCRSPLAHKRWPAVIRLFWHSRQKFFAFS